MANATVIDCGDDCPEDTGSGATTEVTRQSYCPFRDVLTVGSDGSAHVVKSAIQYEDGNYNQFTLFSGCVTALGSIEPKEYVPSLCCPETPATATPAAITNSANACNLSTITDGVLMTSVNFSPVSDYQVTGCGSPSSPFSIQGPSIPDGALITTPCTVTSCITVSGAGTSASPLKVCHDSGVLTAGVYDGITVDACGHITNIDIEGSGVTSSKTYISDDFDIVATGNDNEYRISRKVVTTGKTVEFLGVEVTYNDYGQITAITTPANVGLTTTVDFIKPDTTTGVMTFENGVLTGVT